MKSRIDTMAVSVNNTVSATQTVAQYTFVLPYMSSEVYLRRMSVICDRGVPLGNEFPMFVKLTLTSFPASVGWAFFLRPTIALVVGTSLAFQTLFCNSLKDFVGRVQLVRPGQLYLVTMQVDSTGLAVGDNIAFNSVFEFEVSDSPVAIKE